MAGFRPRQPPVDWDKADYREKRQFLEDVHRCIRLVGSTTVNVGNITAGTNESFTITVEGAKAGMTVELGPPAAIEAGLWWNGFVSADDTVTVRLWASAAGDVNPVNATWYCRVSP